MSRSLTRLTFACAVLLGTLGWAAGPVLPAHAATDTVDVCDYYHLQSAINNAAAGDTITFSCSGTIGVEHTILARNLTIDGSGQAVTLDGGGVNAGCSGDFTIPSSSVSVTLRGLTFVNGAACGISESVILNEGSLTVIDSTFKSNTAAGSNSGGAIANLKGTLIVTNSTFSGNSANYTGGALENAFGTLTVTNSTFSGNSSHGDGGAINNDAGTLTVTGSTFSGNTTGNLANGGAIRNTSSGTMTISNSTFSGNSAPAGGGGAVANAGTATITNSTFSGNAASGFLSAGDAILSGINDGGTVISKMGSTTLTNTILANSPHGATATCAGNAVTDKGGNLDDGSSCGFGSQSRSTTKTLLGPLAGNGGPTQTLALQSGDAAIAFATCLQATDQRGFLRPGSGKTKCDSGAYESGSVGTAAVTLAKWYSDGGVDAGFLQQAAAKMDNSLSVCAGLRTVGGDFNHDGFADVLAYCPSTGAFQKWFGIRGIGDQFTAEPVQYVGNASGAWTNIQMVAADFNGDGKTDILVYRTDNGAYAKWYSDGLVDAGFTYEPVRYVGNAAGAWTNIQMLAADFNGDGKSDILVYRTDNGAYAKWYSDGLVDVGFTYEPVQYVGNAPGAWSNIQMVAAYFSTSGHTAFLVYRTDTGAYAKWYSDGGVDAGFQYEPTQYVGGTSGAWTNITMVTGDFNLDGIPDILVYRTDTGAFQKWYSPSAGGGAGFLHESTQYVGGAASAWTNITMVTGDFNHDGVSDVLVYRAATGAFQKWYGDDTRIGPGFTYQATQYAGGAPGTSMNLQMVPLDFNGDSKTDILISHA